MADKQLPPLYVKILGDDSDLQKKMNDIVNDVAKLAQRLNESINNAVKTSNAGIATAEAEKQRRLEDTHKSRMAALDVKHADQKAIRDAKLQQAQDTAAIKVAASQAKADDERQRRQAKLQSDQLLQQQRIATEQARTDSIHTKTTASVDQAAKTAATIRARINNRINLDMTESAARTADIKLKSLAKVRQINQKTIDEHKKSLADIDAKSKESAAKIAGITAKGAATAAGITLKANAVAAASAKRAAASAAATAAKAAAHVAAIQAKSAATTAKINAQTNYINLQAQMAQTIGQQKLNSMQQQAQQSAAKHSQNMLKTQQQIFLAAKKAARDEQSHVLEMRRMRWKMAREEEAHRQKMRIQEEIHQKRMNSKYYITHPVRATTSVASSGRMRAGDAAGLGAGLTSRADIYMHANAIRALSQSGKGLLDLRINLQYAEVGIQAFTGNAQQASQVMQEIKDHAEKTSFTRLGLADATRNMMSYGMSSKAAIEHVKMLGDVAGGNELRFDRLAFAMSQITSMGRLQGQELRQLTEQGFNPLETMSRHTGKSMLELKKMMEDGAISAAHVTEALRIETSAGGRFADMQMKMAKSLGGLRAQLAEVVKNIQIELVGALENDLKQAMSTAIGYLKQFESFMQTTAGNALVTRIMQMAKNTFIAVMGFHMLGFAIASFMWWMQSAISTVSRLMFIFRGLMVVASLLASIISSPFYLVLAGIAAAASAVLYFTGTLNGPGSIYAAILDLWNLLTAFFTNVVGFFYNFGNNWTLLVQWFGRNWKNLIGDLMEGSVRVFFAMLENAQTMIRMMGRMFVVFFTWLLTSYQNLFSGDVYNAVVDGFIRVFTWLEDKWKSFGDFVGKIWENLFDPAALYEVLMEGMGINETASKMTDDIATTMEKGLFAGMDKVINEEMGNFKTGLEDMAFQTEALPQFDMTVPQWPPPAAPPQLPPAAAYAGPGFDGLGTGRAEAAKIQESMAFRGSDYNKKLAEQAGRFDAVGKAKNPQLAAQQQTNTLLGKIFTAITQQQPVMLQGAGIGGGTP